MPQYKVQGSYIANRGHEHGEPRPHKFNFTVSAKDRADARVITETKIKKLDETFDSLREFMAEVIIPPAVEEALQEPMLE